MKGPRTVLVSLTSVNWEFLITVVPPGSSSHRLSHIFSFS